MSTFTVLFKTNILFSWWRDFLTGMSKFLINYLRVGVVTINVWGPIEVKMWLFFFVFQIIEHHLQQQRLQLNFDHFWIIWELFFNAFSRFLMYCSSNSRQFSVSGLLVKFHINVFIISIVKKLNWDRDCNNNSRNARSLSVLFAKSVNSDYSVGHIIMSNIFCQMLKLWDLDDN